MGACGSCHYDNDESDLYESIDLIKDYYNEMTERLRC
jgi:hypothetical protein